MYAITTADVTGEKYSQMRSAYLNSELILAAGLSEAFAVTFHDFYILFVGGKAYVLDGLQKTYAKGEPYSTHQYEGYVLDNIPARVAWVKDGVLYFGTADGKINAFYTDKTDPLHYSDNGEAICAYWCTPSFLGNLSHNRKRFTYLSITLAPSVVTSVSVFAQQDGIFKKLFSDSTSARYFSFDYLNFAKLTFSTDRTPRCIKRKIDVSVVDKTVFRFENNEVNEPFGIYDLTIEYQEGGKF